MARGLFTEEDVESMLAWPHSGLRVDTRVHLAPGDREGVQDIAKYLAHGPVALSRLTYRKGGGQVVLRPRRVDWRTGRQDVAFEPLVFMAKLLMLLPPPHLKMWRQYCAYAAVVRSVRRRAAEGDGVQKGGVPACETPRRKPCSRSWATLLSRVYGYEPLRCPRCGGEMRVLATIHDPSSIRKILDHLGLDATVPPLQPSRASPPAEQEVFDFSDLLPEVEEIHADPPWADDVPVVSLR